MPDRKPLERGAGASPASPPPRYAPARRTSAAAPVAALLLLLLPLLAGCASFPDVQPYTPGVFDEARAEARAAAARARDLREMPRDAFAYRIHPTDVIEVTVFEYEQMNVSTRVDVNGTINFPPLGEVRAAGLTPAELEQTIADRLRGDYLQDPRIIVTVAEAASQNITILGEVRSPGLQAVWDEVRLLDALAKAGGVTATAGDVAYLVRDTDAAAPGETASGSPEAAPRESPADPGAPPGPDAFRIHLAGLLQRGEKDWNIPLYPGDTLTVPPAGSVHVTGPCIENPGTYPLTFQPKTLTQFIDEAGGLTVGASRKIIFGRCTDPENQEVQFFWVKYKNAIQHPEYDIAMEPGDRIIVIPSFARRQWERAKYILMTTGVSISRVWSPYSVGVGLGSDTRYMRTGY